LHGAEMKKMTFQTHLARDPCKLDLRKLVDQPPEAKKTTVPTLCRSASDEHLIF
jgi:hypothetical protein